MDDVIHRIRGIGGAEFVFSKTIDQIAIENLVLHNFDVIWKNNKKGGS